MTPSVTSLTKKKACKTAYLPGALHYVDLWWTPEPFTKALLGAQNPCKSQKADARTRTGDPFITSEVLYQLSYVGAADRV